MKNNKDLLEEDIEMLTIKELKEYPMEEILKVLKYLDKEKWKTPRFYLLLVGVYRGNVMLKKNKNRVHPSYYVKEMLENKNMSFLDLIKGEDISKIKMLKFIEGNTGVDSEIAYLLARKLNTSINLWFNLQKEYKRNNV